ncbi:hypothetical protein BDV93DRAFT_68354 [Ceratobasidium sp. AG-I]|nr:hypothetical protein BDV93DRAFT_68354 [Ceratobasidium sp. AG-I]
MPTQPSSKPHPPKLRSTLIGKSVTDDVVNSWKAAHAALASSVEAYVRACSDLESFCRLASVADEREDLEDICDTLEQHIPALFSHERSLQLVRAGLQRQRNTSSRLSPIRQLPLEVLAFIFTIAVSSDRIERVLSHPKPLSVDFANVLASVCSHWRRVAIGIPELWTYVDLSRRGALDHASLWLERARNRAIDIRTGSETIYPDWRHQHTPLVQNANRARSLLLRGGRDYMNLWLSRWYQDGIPGTTTTLALHPALQDDDLLHFPGASMPSQTTLDDLLRPISVLYLRHVVVAWGQVSFQDLVILCLADLEQDTAGYTLTVDILYEILLASPRIRCLQLARLDLHPVESISGRQSFPPVRLEHLETLEFSNVQEPEASQLLSIITPGSRSLAFAICSTGEYGNVDTEYLLSFLQRSNVTTFYCGANTLAHFPPAIIFALKNIEVLFLVDQTIDANFSDSVLPKHITLDSIRTRWPKLHTLEFKDCEFEDIVDFKRLLSVCPIRELRINAGCSTSVTIGDERDHGSLEFADWAGPGVTFSYDCREWEIGYMPFQ